MAAVQQVQAQEKVLSQTDYPRIFFRRKVLARGSDVPNNGSTIGNWNGCCPGGGIGWQG